MSATSIEWTDRTWNPTRGCSRVSEGCRNCYAERFSARFGETKGHAFEGFARMRRTRPEEPLYAQPQWTGRVELIPEKLEEPLHWKKPQRIFVNSMSDLFHEALSDRLSIRPILEVIAACPRHTFQVLTKRPQRMNLVVRQWLEDRNRGLPPENLWLGVSVEDQATADERIPLLLQTPAAKRFVSYEPGLGPVDFSPWLGPIHPHSILDWVICGGESGPGSRPFDLRWAWKAVDQCRQAGVPIFVKQMGAKPVIGPLRMCGSWEAEFRLKDRKGGDMSEWPQDLRVREFPA